MIGRLQVLLPYLLYVPSDQPLRPVARSRDGYELEVHPPIQSAVDRSILSLESDEPVASVFDGFTIRPGTVSSQTVTYGGRPTIPVDLLRVDVRLPDDFERTKPAADDLFALARDEANVVLARLRVLGRGSHVRAISDRTCSRFQFLRDDETAFESAPPLVSAARVYGHPTDVLVVPRELWEAAWGLSDDYRPPAWDALILDAVALLPDVGPAMVLAYAALEARITAALEVLASEAEVDSVVWDWLNKRDNDYSKQPSISERFDVLLRWLAGKSLKDDAPLWEGFQRLRQARNSFAHTGIAELGRKLKEPVTHEQALTLVATAERIIRWVDSMLPAAHQRPTLGVPVESLSIVKRQTHQITAAVSPASGVTLDVRPLPADADESSAT